MVLLELKLHSHNFLFTVFVQVIIIIGVQNKSVYVYI